MKYHRNNEKVGMIMAAAIAAVSIAAFVLFDFALGTGAQRGPSMISAAAIERAGASVVVTGALGEIHQRQEAENSGPVGH